MHKQCVIRARAYHADPDTILRIPAGETVEAIETFAGVEVVFGAFAVDGERGMLKRDVHRSPPNVLLGGWMDDNPLVFRRTAGFRAGISHEGAIFGDTGVLLITNRVFVKRTY